MCSAHHHFFTLSYNARFRCLVLWSDVSLTGLTNCRSPFLDQVFSVKKDISTATLSRDLLIYLVVVIKSNLLFVCSRPVMTTDQFALLEKLQVWRKCSREAAAWCPQMETTVYQLLCFYFCEEYLDCCCVLLPVLQVKQWDMLTERILFSKDYVILWKLANQTSKDSLHQSIQDDRRPYLRMDNSLLKTFSSCS